MTKRAGKTRKAEPDWKAIAGQLAQRVNFAMTYLRPGPVNPTGAILNINTGAMRHWREYFADALEAMPGVTVDREAMHLFDLPKREQVKAFKRLEAKRKSAA